MHDRGLKDQQHRDAGEDVPVRGARDGEMALSEPYAAMQQCTPYTRDPLSRIDLGRARDVPRTSGARRALRGASCAK